MASPRLGAVLALAVMAFAILPAGAQTGADDLPLPVPPLPPPRPVAFAAVPGWAEERHAELLPTLQANCSHLQAVRPDLPLGGAWEPAERAGTASDWQGFCNDLKLLRQSLPPPPRMASRGNPVALRRGHAVEMRRWHEARQLLVRQFLENRLQPFAAGTGTMTGYFEPVLHGRTEMDLSYATPLLARPPELVDLPGAEPGRRRFGRMREGRLEPFYDRGTIEDGALSGRRLELVWVEDAAAAFFLHIQGSGRVVLPDGTLLRLGYAAQNGHPFVPLGRVLLERGEIPRDRMSMQALRDWLHAAGPERAAEAMRTNPSYIFFRRVEGLSPEQGPIGAMGVPLTPGRSVAVDRAYIPLGAPLFVNTRDPLDRRPVNRLVLAQDTGGAIRGPARTDFFWGWGDEAGERAGRMREEAEVFILLPRLPEVADAPR